MLKMVMNFNKVELRTEQMFFMEVNDPKYPEGTWLYSKFDNRKTPEMRTKEQVLLVLQKPFTTVQYDNESKTLIIIRSEAQIKAEDDRLREFINKTAKEAGYVIGEKKEE
jgi:hypothetical protein